MHVLKNLTIVVIAAEEIGCVDIVKLFAPPVLVLPTYVIRPCAQAGQVTLYIVREQCCHCLHRLLVQQSLHREEKLLDIKQLWNELRMTKVTVVVDLNFVQQSVHRGSIVAGWKRL